MHACMDSLRGLMGGKILLKFALTLDIITSEVLLVSLVHSEGAENVQNETSTEVESNRVLSAIVE